MLEQYGCMERNMKIIEKIYDIQTGETTVIEREESVEEKAEREKTEAEHAAAIEAKAQTDIKRAALLEKLGITEEEARLLLG